MWKTQALLILCIVFMFFKKTRKSAIAGFIGVFFSALLVELVWKGMFDRIRPYDAFAWAKLIGEPSDTFSFPSGHASAAFAVATGFSWFQKKWWPRILFFASAVLTAFSRVYISIHWTTDVLAGAVNGILCGLLATLVVTQVSNLFSQWSAKRKQLKAQRTTQGEPANMPETEEG